ncbi:MAG: hypothetical protein GKS06_00045 [Acidobacteria bacterium]|nr:hypothetical protein [Acidobacteriota bacterium]
MMAQALAITMFILMVMATFVVLLAVPTVFIGGLVYAFAGPELRMKMIGWAPGVKHGVRKTLGLARDLQSQPSEGSE